TPSPVASSTAIPAAIPLLLATVTPTATLSPQPADTCRETQGTLSVAALDSVVLGHSVAYSIYLPPCYDTDAEHIYPALYLLHGANTDHTQWPDLNVATDADSLIAQKAIPPLVVVMPGGSYQPDENYEAFVLGDLIPHIEQTTRVGRDPGQRAIGGVSHGGWLALDLAAAHPDVFGAAGGHSPAIDDLLTRQFARLGAASTLRIYLDVGQDDPLASRVAAFAHTLEAQGLKPVFHIYPGTHNRPYWRAHTAEYLSFYTAKW
ncbi:MAG TPA: alpha/beta hydrolase-fold protein, partial [Anaerolineales bacterium]